MVIVRKKVSRSMGCPAQWGVPLNGVSRLMVEHVIGVYTVVFMVGKVV
jgi:hypothetical protein